MSALRDKLARISVLIFAVAVVGVGATVAGATPRVSASAAEKPKWLVIPAF